MSDFPLVELHSTSIQIIDGDRGVNYPKKTEFSEQGYCLFLDSSNLTKNGFDFSSKTFISKAVDERMGKGHLQRGDLVMNTRGTIGNIGLYSDNISFGSVRINSGMVIIRGGEDYDTRFLYLFLRSDMFFSQTKNLMSGSVQKQLPVSVIKYVKLPKVDLPTQQKIAAVLTALDAKIELNQRINAELESMAKTLYDYWFVQFDFPNEKGKPYKSAGGKMVWNEELKREIPLGWEVGTLEQIVKIRNGFAFKSEDYQESGRLIIRTKNFDNNSIVLNDVVYISEEKAKEYSDFELSKFDFLLVMVGASVGKSVITPSYILPALQNQNMWNFLPKNEKHKIYTNFLMSRIVEEQAQSANGSARDFFRKDHFYGLKIAIPDDSIVEEFQKITLPIFEKIDVVIKESQTLTELRDWLLPMLMNGQVRV